MACFQAGYDFNDDVIPIVAALWVRVVEAKFGVTLYDSVDGLTPALPPIDKDLLARFITVRRG